MFLKIRKTELFMQEYTVDSFDIKLATECAEAFYGSTGVGCLVSDSNGIHHVRCGHNCSDCRVCEAAGRDRAECMLA